MRTEQDVLQKRIQGCLNEIVQSKWGKLIEEFLDENEPVLLEDLKMESEEGGWQSTLPENYLWKRWLHGQDSGKVQGRSDIWSLSKPQRDDLIETWSSQHIADPTDAIRIHLEEYQDVNRRVQTLRSISKSRTVRGVSIIGCTTCMLPRTVIRSHLSPCVVDRKSRRRL
jgi:hypothetical protein